MAQAEQRSKQPLHYQKPTFCKKQAEQRAEQRSKQAEQRSTDTMSKADISTLAGVSKVYLNDHKSEYKQDSRGVWVKDFLYWLKIKNLKGFEKFKINWVNRKI